jgi:predicted RNase H-like nuclease
MEGELNLLLCDLLPPSAVARMS